jgi:exodeoxyribonuclease VII large subunit
MLRERTDPRVVLTVSQLTRDIKTILENSFPEVWVTGEISNLSRPASGHIYFTLKDSHSQIRCVFFKDYNQRLRFSLQDGLELVCFGRIGVYEKQGNYQLYINLIEPKGAGALQLAFEQLKEKLAKEGLFDTTRKKIIPAMPQRIAFITSASGAVIHDMLTILKRRAFQARVTLFGVRVQGEGAAEEIVAALKLANRFAGEFDCLVLARGGGSLEDLWPFNEEIVARAVFASAVPTVSAIGHEVDWTICDFVADMRAPTPSAAMELLIPSRQELQKTIEDLIRRLEQSMAGQVPQYQQRIDELILSLSRNVRQFIELKQANIQGFIDRLNALSPLAILKRGYSITFDKKKKEVIKNIEAVDVGVEITTLLADGSLESTVTKKLNN